MFNAQCSMFNVQYLMFNVQCLMLNAQCSMFNVQCLMFQMPYNKIINAGVITVIKILKGVPKRIKSINLYPPGP